MTGVTVSPTLFAVEVRKLIPACDVLFVPFVWSGIVQDDPSVQVWPLTVVELDTRAATGTVAEVKFAPLSAGLFVNVGAALTLPVPCDTSTLSVAAVLPARNAVFPELD